MNPWAQEAQPAKIDLISGSGDNVLGDKRLLCSEAVDKLKLYPPIRNFRLIQAQAKVERYLAH